MFVSIWSAWPVDKHFVLSSEFSQLAVAHAQKLSFFCSGAFWITNRFDYGLKLKRLSWICSFRYFWPTLVNIHSRMRKNSHIFCFGHIRITNRFDDGLKLERFSWICAFWYFRPNLDTIRSRIRKNSYYFLVWRYLDSEVTQRLDDR